MPLKIVCSRCPNEAKAPEVPERYRGMALPEGWRFLSRGAATADVPPMSVGRYNYWVSNVLAGFYFYATAEYWELCDECLQEFDEWLANFPGRLGKPRPSSRKTPKLKS